MNLIQLFAARTRSENRATDTLRELRTTKLLPLTTVEALESTLVRLAAPWRLADITSHDAAILLQQQPHI